MMYATYTTDFHILAEESDSRDTYGHLNFDQLSNRELLAILISADDDCEDSNLNQADLILNHVGADLSKLAWLSLKDLLEIKGLRYGKALVLASANVLLHKRTANKHLRLYKPDDSNVSFKIIKAELDDAKEESHWIFLFDGQGKLQHKEFMGDASGSFNDHHRILQIALEHHSSSLLLVSRGKKRNNKATKITRSNVLALIEAANTLSMVILDYIVTDSNGYRSYRDMGWLDE